jgi:hypothetical protein
MIQRTTIDLPQDVWLELKIRAAQERKSLKAIILDAVVARTKKGRRPGGRG